MSFEALQLFQDSLIVPHGGTRCYVRFEGLWQSVHQFLAVAGLVMGASLTAYTTSDLNTAVFELNAAFGGGFARQILCQVRAREGKIVLRSKSE